VPGSQNCHQGYVWREAFAADRVCVTGDVRSRSAEENQLAFSRAELSCRQGDLKILTLNPGGLNVVTNVNTNEVMAPEWRERSARLARLMERFQIEPDFIALQQIEGWSSNAIAPDWWDYEGLDVLIRDLEGVTGVTYRIAYMTGGPPRPHNLFPVNWAYGGHAILYNPNRLVNLTPGLIGQAGVGHDEDVRGSHVRRSLPLCNRGPNPLMPLDNLIDGPPQRDKCNRDTPSGPTWAVVTENDHIAATFNRFGLAWDPGQTFDVFNVNPAAGQQQKSDNDINQLIRDVSRQFPPARSAMIPPLMLGDFNSSSRDDAAAIYSGFQLMARSDVNMVMTGDDRRHWSACRSPAITSTLDVPNVDDLAEQISDHRGYYVQMSFAEPRSEACTLRHLSIDVRPSPVGSRQSYSLVATAFGGSRNYSYRWQPGGETSLEVRRQAGDSGQAQTDQVTATDLASGRSLSATATVTPFNSQCQQECEVDRDSCMDRSGGGSPLPGQCANTFMRCMAACGAR
jgi:hypothetical protein